MKDKLTLMEQEEAELKLQEDDIDRQIKAMENMSLANAFQQAADAASQAKT
jgi:hypothetical protein